MRLLASCSFRYFFKTFSFFCKSLRKDKKGGVFFGCRSMVWLVYRLGGSLLAFCGLKKVCACCCRQLGSSCCCGSCCSVLFY